MAAHSAKSSSCRIALAPASEQHANILPSSFGAQLRKTLNTIPAYTWYALPSGVLTFVNEGFAALVHRQQCYHIRLLFTTHGAWLQPRTSGAGSLGRPRTARIHPPPHLLL